MSAPKPNPSAIVKASNTQAPRTATRLQDVTAKKPQVSQSVDGIKAVKTSDGKANNISAFKVNQKSTPEKGGNQR